MSTPPPIPPTAPEPAAYSRLGAAEAAIVISAITAVTVLAVLERPIPALLATLAAATGLLLLPGRALRLITALAALTSGGRP